MFSQTFAQAPRRGPVIFSKPLIGWVRATVTASWRWIDSHSVYGLTGYPQVSPPRLQQPRVAWPLWAAPLGLHPQRKGYQNPGSFFALYPVGHVLVTSRPAARTRIDGGAHGWARDAEHITSSPDEGQLPMFTKGHRRRSLLKNHANHPAPEWTWATSLWHNTIVEKPMRQDKDSAPPVSRRATNSAGYSLYSHVKEQYDSMINALFPGTVGCFCAYPPELIPGIYHIAVILSSENSGDLGGKLWSAEAEPTLLPLLPLRTAAASGFAEAAP